ncbi:MAG: hypothetical protein A4S09_05955 [Proteobacteria bacterium SG_bin7]|nr:MAG: hypothetical protein A4S09_05955 [Proteobacteria bacterium SG_bin7]
MKNFFRVLILISTVSFASFVSSAFGEIPSAKGVCEKERCDVLAQRERYFRKALRQAEAKRNAREMIDVVFGFRNQTRDLSEESILRMPLTEFKGHYKKLSGKELPEDFVESVQQFLGEGGTMVLKPNYADVEKMNDLLSLLLSIKSDYKMNPEIRNLYSSLLVEATLSKRSQGRPEGSKGLLGER